MKPRAITAPELFERLAKGEPLPEEVAHYFLNVLRLSSGEAVEVGDGRGLLVSGVLSPAEAGWRLTGAQMSATEQGQVGCLTLMAGILKASRWRLVVEKAVELGVGQIVPVVTERTVGRRTAKQRASFVERSNRIAEAAASQCRRLTVARISEPTSFQSALSAVTEPNRLVAALSASSEQALDWEREMEPGQPTVLLIGPEGGLTGAELAAANRAGFRSVSLGGYTLRAETATVVLLAMVRDRLGIAIRELASGSDDVS